jgi:hypothetical protein
VKALYVLIAATLVISLITIAALAQKASANPSPGLSEWDRVLTPSEDGWLLAPNSTIIDYALAANGEVAYAIVDKEGESYHLLKSTDSAATWQNITEGVNDEIEKRSLGNPEDLAFVNVATDGEDRDFVALALNVSPTGLRVFISNDGGSTFKDTGVIDLDEAFDLAVSPEDGDGWRDLAIGGIGDGKGRILRLQVYGNLGYGWEDTSTWDGWLNCTMVADIRFSPRWSEDHAILAVTFNNTNVHLQAGILGETELWNENAGLKLVTVMGSVTHFLGAGIALPLDYKATDKNRALWVWLNYATNTTSLRGEIFKVMKDGTTAQSIMAQIDGRPLLTNVSYWGDIAGGKAIAGVLGDGKGGPTDCCAGVPVYHNTDVASMEVRASSWQAAAKPPTGRLAMAAFYASYNKAYAVALGAYDPYDEGAWSVSFDDGDTWNQLSLVDTYISYFSDVAVSPDCNKMMLVSVNIKEEGEYCGCDSVWVYAKDFPANEGYNEYSGKWLRTWCDVLKSNHGLLRLAPDDTSGETVYLVDYGTKTMYWNTLPTLAGWEVSYTTKLGSIVDLAVKDKSTIYALGEDGMVAMSNAEGWHACVDSKIKNGWTIAVRGDDILVGGQYGDVAYSSDGGKNFTELENVPVSGLGTVAFDTYFNANNTTYVAIAAGGNTGAIYRWVIGQSTEWQALDAEPYAYTGIVLSNADGNPMTSADTGGILYASYVSGNTTGVARCLTPAGDISCGKCIEWDYLEVGLSGEECFQAMPQALKNCGCLTPDSNTRLLAIDSSQEYDMDGGETGAVWSFEDCYAKAAPSLTAPTKGFLVPADPCHCSSVPFALRWQRQCDARAYDIQIALDRNFSEIMEDILGYEPPTLSTPGYFVTKGELLPGVTYYWRVRAVEAETGQIIHSWWSTSLSFTVALGTVAGPDLFAPQDGAADVSITKVAFTWSALVLADKYDWVLSKNADLSSPVETKPGLTTTAYTYKGTLEYGTTYYWQVTAWKEGVQISQSNTGSFRTKAKTSFPVVPPPVTPFWVWVVIAIGAVMVIVVIVLMFRTRRE